MYIRMHVCISMDKWIRHHDLILGIEAFVDIEQARQFGMDKIGYTLNNKVISVCNWTFASTPKHIFFKNISDNKMNKNYSDYLIRKKTSDTLIAIASN